MSLAEGTTNNRAWGITHQLENNTTPDTMELKQGKYIIGDRRAGTEAVCTMGRNPIKTAAIMALLALAGISIAKAIGHGSAFDTLKKLVLDHKIESAIIAGGLGLGVLGYAHGRREEGAKLWTEFKDSIAELRAMLPSLPRFSRKLELESDDPQAEEYDDIEDEMLDDGVAGENERKANKTKSL